MVKELLLDFLFSRFSACRELHEKVTYFFMYVHCATNLPTGHLTNRLNTISLTAAYLQMPFMKMFRFLSFILTSRAFTANPSVFTVITVVNSHSPMSARK